MESLVIDCSARLARLSGIQYTVGPQTWAWRPRVNERWHMPASPRLSPGQTPLNGPCCGRRAILTCFEELYLRYWLNLSMITARGDKVLECFIPMFSAHTCANKLWNTMRDFRINWLKKILPPRSKQMKNNLIFICSVNICIGIRIPAMFEQGV